MPSFSAESQTVRVSEILPMLENNYLKTDNFVVIPCMLLCTLHVVMPPWSVRNKRRGTIQQLFITFNINSLSLLLSLEFKKYDGIKEFDTCYTGTLSCADALFTIFTCVLHLFRQTKTHFIQTKDELAPIQRKAHKGYFDGEFYCATGRGKFDLKSVEQWGGGVGGADLLATAAF